MRAILLLNDLLRKLLLHLNAGEGQIMLLIIIFQKYLLGESGL